MGPDRLILPGQPVVLPHGTPFKAEPSPTVRRALKFLEAVGSTLVEKNAKYGDSAANPLRLFSKTDAAEQIRVRIDDKLSRLRTMGDAAREDEDTLKDLVGYLALLAAVRSTSKGEAP